MSLSHTILIVDDEAAQRQLLGGYLQSTGYRTVELGSGEAALAWLAESNADLVLLDVRLPGINGLETLDQLRRRGWQGPVLLITAYADLKQAVAAVKQGAADYLAKPVDLEELRVTVSDALGLSGELERRAAGKLPPIPADMVFESPATHHLLETLAVVAPSDVPVLVRGETGTGKEVIARLLHLWSPRKNGPLITANCAGIPDTLIESELFGHAKGAFTGAADSREGVFRAADRSTLFLDELGELPLHLQPKLLRALETGQVTPVGRDHPVQIDTRFIAATNRDLELEVQEGRFREDLYYRINVVEVVVEPLRRRREDILPLARLYAARFSGGPIRLSPQANQCLLVYSWPGNVRELRNAIQRACLLSRGDIILPDHLPPRVAAVAGDTAVEDDAGDRLSQVERATILATLEECGRNRTQAAKKLGISRRALIYKLRAIEAERGTN